MSCYQANNWGENADECGSLKANYIINTPLHPKGTPPPGMTIPLWGDLCDFTFKSKAKEFYTFYIKVCMTRVTQIPPKQNESI